MGDVESPLTASGFTLLVDGHETQLEEAQVHSLMTQSQEIRLQVQLGQMNDIKETLLVLINAPTTTESQLERFLTLYERITNAIGQFKEIFPNISLETQEKEVEEDSSALNNEPLRVSQIVEMLDPYSSEEEKKEYSELDLRDSSANSVEDNNKYFDCPICYEQLDVVENTIKLKNCGHRFCERCVVSFLRSQVESGAVSQLCCMDYCCGIQLDEEEIEAHMEPANYEKYQRFLFISQLREETNCRWCPSPTCETPTIADPESEEFPKLTCSACETKFCFHCSRNWHEGLTCKQYWKQISTRRERRREKKTDKWKQKRKTQFCAGCNLEIAKDSGCNHMTCQICGYQWCWVCGEKYQDDHYSVGKCAGLQFSSHPKLTRVTDSPVAKGVGVIVATPIVIGAGAVLLTATVAACAVAIPIYGAYRLKKRVSRKSKRSNYWLYEDDGSEDLAPVQLISQPSDAEEVLKEDESTSSTSFEL